MPYQLHDIEIVPGSTGLHRLDRLTVGLQANVANASSPGSITSTATIEPAYGRGQYTILPAITYIGNGSGATASFTLNLLSATAATIGSGYAPADTVTFTGGTGTEPVLTLTTTQLATCAVNAAGTGYAPLDQITLAGGVFTTAATLTVQTTKVISEAVLAAGSGYAINDTITVAGGAGATAAVLTVTHAQLVSLAINAAGSGYAPGDTITLAGGTSSVAAVVTVLTVASGGILTFNITTPGNYTVESTTFTQTSTSGSGTGATFKTGLFGVLTASVTTAGSYTTNATTFTQASSSGSGTGATFNTIVYGVNTISVTNRGVYSTNASSFTQGSTTGVGTGATFNTGLYGVGTWTISTAGSLTVLATSPVSTTSSGSGTGATFNAVYQLNTLTASGGSGYDNNSYASLTGGNFSGTPPRVPFVLSNTGNAATVPISFSAGANLPSSGTYCVFVNPQQACLWEVDSSSKTSTGFNVVLTPTSGNAISAGVIDVLVIC